MTDHWRTYEPIPSVVGFDSRGAGPFIDLLTVTANVSAAEPIAVHIGSLASGVLTVEQSRTLRALLERAEQDVQRGATEDPPEVSDGEEVARG